MHSNNKTGFKRNLVPTSRLETPPITAFLARILVAAGTTQHPSTCWIHRGRGALEKDKVIGTISLEA